MLIEVGPNEQVIYEENLSRKEREVDETHPAGS